MSEINWLSIEILASVNDDDEAIELCTTSKNICPRKGEYVWMPYQWDGKEKWGTRSFIVEEVCHTISPNIKGTYDSIKVYCTPVTEETAKQDHKDQQIKDLEYLLSFANEYMERMKPLFETPIDTASLHFKFMLDYKSYQQKYPKPQI